MHEYEISKNIFVCARWSFDIFLPVFILFLSATAILFILLSYINDTIYRIALLRLALSSVTIFRLIDVLRSSAVTLFTVIFYHSLFSRNTVLYFFWLSCALKTSTKCNHLHWIIPAIIIFLWRSVLLHLWLVWWFYPLAQCCRCPPVHKLYFVRTITRHSS